MDVVGGGASRKSTQLSSLGSIASNFDMQRGGEANAGTHGTPTPVSLGAQVAPAFSGGATAAAQPPSLAFASSTSETDAAAKLEHHLALLAHTAYCDGGQCGVADCAKMRAFMAHANTCEAGNMFGGAQPKCLLCRRYSLLAHLHSRLCQKSIGHCRVPKCSTFKVQYSRDSMDESSHGGGLGDEEEAGMSSFLDMDDRDTRASSMSSVGADPYTREFTPSQILILLLHAGTCQGCDDPRCIMMKRELTHTRVCPLAPSGCLRFKYCMPARHLLTHHASCSDAACDKCKEARGIQPGSKLPVWSSQ